MGKHNAPSKPLAPMVAKAGAVAVVSTGSFLLSGGVADASPAPAANTTSASILETIAKCESGNRNVNHNSALSGIKSTASGYLQILDSTWRAFGGTQFATRAIHATRDQQFVVGARILAGQGINAWNPSRNCWGSKISTANPKTVITPKPQEFKVSPPKKITPKTVVKKVTPPTKAPAPTTHQVAKKVAESYLIRKGDTLSGIARSHHTTVRRLASINRDTVKNVNLIYYGKHLRLV